MFGVAGFIFTCSNWRASFSRIRETLASFSYVRDSELHFRVLGFADLISLCWDLRASFSSVGNCGLHFRVLGVAGFDFCERNYF